MTVTDITMAHHDRAAIPFETGADLTGASVPKMWALNVVTQSVTTLNVVTIPTPANGRALWTPNADLPPGSYDLELEVIQGGVPVTYPNDSRDRPRLEVYADLG